MEKRTHKEIDAEVRFLHDSDNEISEKIDHDETMKEQTEKDLQIEVERKYTEYHNFKRADLPIYKKRIWFDSVWYYKLSCEKTRLILQRIDIKKYKPIPLSTPDVEDILDKDNIDCDAKEWRIAVGKLLTQLDNPKK